MVVEIFYRALKVTKDTDIFGQSFNNYYMV